MPTVLETNGSSNLMHGSRRSEILGKKYLHNTLDTVKQVQSSRNYFKKDGVKIVTLDLNTP